MTLIFADTSYWIALMNPRDQLHAKALQVTKQFSNATILTTEMVLVELLNAFGDAGRLRNIVAGVVQTLRGTGSVRIVPQTADQFENALRRYKEAKDKSWSLTDCASFDVMFAANVNTALTHDRHFVQAGFEALLR